VKNNRYDYLPIIGRPKLQLPGGARVAFWVGLNIEYFHIDQPLLSAPSRHLPDVPGYCLRDYGSRIGVFRIMDALDRRGMRASVLLNSDVCEHHPEIIEEGKKRHWEWLGHGLTNNKRINDYPAEEERSVVRQVKETIRAATGADPKGWLGPGLMESYRTPDHLAAEGFEYLCDWGCDDQPVPMRVEAGRMIAMPYQQGVNDMTILVNSQHTPEQYLRQVCDQFDTLYAEGAESGRVMALPLHPFVTGLPFRIKYLDKALEYIGSHDGVWRATAGEIADWYYRNHYREPGIPG
jgi:peptidoglycan/xylan/chitin deacetylase (PgdA/CDA1 family)